VDTGAWIERNGFVVLLRRDQCRTTVKVLPGWEADPVAYRGSNLDQAAMSDSSGLGLVFSAAAAVAAGTRTASRRLMYRRDRRTDWKVAVMTPDVYPSVTVQVMPTRQAAVERAKAMAEEMLADGARVDAYGIE
jgi:hypothetical protein